MGAQRASHSLSALAGRHHDGAGCGWGGAGGVAVEMIPLPIALTTEQGFWDPYKGQVNDGQLGYACAQR